MLEVENILLEVMRPLLSCVQVMIIVLGIVTHVRSYLWHHKVISCWYRPAISLQHQILFEHHKIFSTASWLFSCNSSCWQIRVYLNVGMERIGQWWLSVWLYHLQYHVSSDESTTELGSLISSVNIIISASSDHINTLAPHISLCICIQSTTVTIAFVMSIFIFIRNINDPRKYSTNMCVCLQSKLQIWWFYLSDKLCFNSDKHITK